MRLLIVLLILCFCVVPVAAQTPTSTPIPLPNEEIFDALQDADESLGDVDDPLSSPDGSPLLPDQDGTIIFGYAKWLLSPGAADELVGPFAPVISHIFIYLAMRVALFGIYLVVYLAVYLIKWAIWIFKLVLAIVSTAAEVLNVITDFAAALLAKSLGLSEADMIPPTPTAFPAGEAIFTVPAEYSLWASTDLAIQTWHWLGNGRIVIQVIILIMIVIAGLYIFNRFISDNTRRDAEL